MKAYTLLLFLALFACGCLANKMDEEKLRQAADNSGVSFGQPSPGLSYAGSPFAFTINVLITAQTPTMTGTITSCSVNPVLPTGLNLNTSNCTISGTPTILQGATNYTITADTDKGSLTGTISIAVNDVAPSALSYAGSPYVYFMNTAITPVNPTVTGVPVSYSVSPALPTGLTINPATGQLAGTPTVVSAATTYTVTAVNTGGSTTFAINVKVNPVITAVWAKTVTGGNNYTQYYAVKAETAGNAYAAGEIRSNVTFDFGNGVTAAGLTASNSYIILTKYDTNGNAQWAKTLTSGGNQSSFWGLAVDSAGNSYAAGVIDTTAVYNFGNSVTVSGSWTGLNGVFVKYNTSGLAQWAKSATGPNETRFYSAAVDSSGNSFVVAECSGTGTYNLGNSVTVGVAGTVSPIIAKYDASGVTQWSRSRTAGANNTWFSRASADSSGNVYAVGSITGAGTITYSAGISVTVNGTGGNFVIVKYAPNGTVLWARAVATSPASNSSINEPAFDSAGDPVFAGYLNGAGTHDFGNGIVATPAAGSSFLIKYASDGTAQWVKLGASGATFYGIAIDGSDNVFLVGNVTGTGLFNFGSGVAFNGPSGFNNPFVLRYDSSGNAVTVKTLQSAPNNSGFSTIGLASDGSIYTGNRLQVRLILVQVSLFRDRNPIMRWS